VLDAFFDPSNAASVLAIASPLAAGASLFASSDGGRTFGTTLLTSGTPPVRADERLLSVEIAASAPVVYVTAFALPSATSPGSAALLRSGDGGASWSRFDLASAPGVQVKIAQVDPADANTVYLLVSSAAADEIWITNDGGANVRPLLVPNAILGGFVRALDGALYAGTGGGDFYARAPGATDFARLRGPHLRCLGERAGRIYACGDSTVDAYDLATSDDQGKSFQKLLSFTDILGPATCPAVQSACAADFAQLRRTLAVIPAGSCSCGQPSGDAVAVLILLAAALRRRRRAPARDRR
jgi:MYXO-CTERM domain-containing protein